MLANFKKACLLVSLILALCQSVSNFGENLASSRQSEADEPAVGLSCFQDSPVIVSLDDQSLPQVQPEKTKPTSVWRPSTSASVAIRATAGIPLVFSQLCIWPQPLQQASSLQAKQIRLQV